MLSKHVTVPETGTYIELYLSEASTCLKQEILITLRCSVNTGWTVLYLFAYNKILLEVSVSHRTGLDVWGPPTRRTPNI